MLNDLCPHCSGRGFQWQTGHIISRRDGTIMATTFKEGERCQVCHGSGRRDQSAKICGLLALALVILFFAAYFAFSFIKG